MEVIRSPLQTRPLSLKNTDNKLVVSANMDALKSTYCKLTHHVQNGFVKGRNFLNNILDLDSAGRIYSWRHWDKLRDRGVTHMPVSAAFDFAAAFPSVIHAWMWLVLEHRKLPADF